MKNLIKGCVALLVGVFAVSANANAQNVTFNGIGSSALFLELGLAASAPSTGSPAGLGATCLWTTNTSGVVKATDNSSNGGGKTETGNAFVAWTPLNGSCSTVNSSTVVYAYLQTDSVVGDRCLFNGCTITTTGSGSSPAGIIGGANEVALAAGIATALNGKAISVAGTDIRPEDAEFAITRALTPCGTAVASGSQYLGLGYLNGNTIDSYFSGSTFNVIKFSLPSSFFVTPVGATPIVVVVNGPGSNNGFSDPNITNMDRSTLAAFLDGTYQRTHDGLTVAATGTSLAPTVLIREPLSGTYNTMEYNVPNTVALKTSQDVGLNQPAVRNNCNGTAVKSNPLNIVTRKRAIGTGQELSEVIATSDSLGYGFWSVANFKGFTNAAAPNAKYLTIDGVDPLQDSYTGGTVPTTSAELANVTLSNVANGSYPIWSNLRLVNIGGAATASVANLAKASQNFVPATTRPDFIPATSLKVVRSHFIPPAGSGQPTTASNGAAGSCSASEVGGDVGGSAYTIQGDQDYCHDFSSTTGQTGRRQ